MQKIFSLLFLAFSISNAYSQNIYKAQIKDATTGEPLVGSTAILQGTTNGSSADINGNIEIRNIPDGKQIIILS